MNFTPRPTTGATTAAAATALVVVVVVVEGVEKSVLPSRGGLALGPRRPSAALGQRGSPCPATPPCPATARNTIMHCCACALARFAPSTTRLAQPPPRPPACRYGALSALSALRRPGQGGAGPRARGPGRAWPSRLDRLYCSLGTGRSGAPSLIFAWMRSAWIREGSSDVARSGKASLSRLGVEFEHCTVRPANPPSPLSVPGVPRAAASRDVDADAVQGGARNAKRGAGSRVAASSEERRPVDDSPSAFVFSLSSPVQ